MASILFKVLLHGGHQQPSMHHTASASGHQPRLARLVYAQLSNTTVQGGGTDGAGQMLIFLLFCLGGSMYDKFFLPSSQIRMSGRCAYVRACITTYERPAPSL